MAGLCEASCVAPYTAQASNIVCEEDHGGDPAAIATASYPEWENARGVARLSPVWLKYCVASRGLAMIVAEQATEALSPLIDYRKYASMLE